MVQELLLSIKQNQVMGLLADVQPLLIGEVTKALEWGREVCNMAVAFSLTVQRSPYKL